MSERASGWYDDPENPAEQLRYWDGILWSDRTMPKVRPDLERSNIGSPSLPPQPPTPSREQAPPSGSYWHSQSPSGDGVQHGGAVTADGSRLSGWWRRVGAVVIDNLLVFALSAALTWTWLHPWLTAYQNWINDVFDAAQSGAASPDLPAAVQNLPWQTLVANLAILAVYEIGMIWRFGQTVGKKVTGIRVRATESDRTLTLPETALRFLVKQIAVIVQPLGAIVGFFTIIDYLWPLWDKLKQSLHDKAAKSYVVRSR